MVGKSSLTYRFINYNAPEEHDPTIEDKFLTVVDIDKKSVTVNLLDTAGQDDYQSLIDDWIMKNDGFILVFAINERQSFTDLDKRKAKIDIIKKKAKVPIVLVGNKMDMKHERKVSQKEAEEKAKLWGAIYIEVSAKTDENCKTPFIECAKMILKNNQPQQQTPITNKQSSNTVNVKSNSCCTIF